MASGSGVDGLLLSFEKQLSVLIAELNVSLKAMAFEPFCKDSLTAHEEFGGSSANTSFHVGEYRQSDVEVIPHNGTGNIRQEETVHMAATSDDDHVKIDQDDEPPTQHGLPHPFPGPQATPASSTSVSNSFKRATSPGSLKKSFSFTSTISHASARLKRGASGASHLRRQFRDQAQVSSVSDLASHEGIATFNVDPKTLAFLVDDRQVQSRISEIHSQPQIKSVKKSAVNREMLLDCCSVFVILLDAGIYGYEVDMRARNLKVDMRAFLMISIVFTIWYFCEFGLRIRNDGVKKNRTMNLIDLAFLGIAVIDLFSRGVRMLRLFRLARVARIFRVSRMVRYFPTFSKLTACVVRSMPALMGAVTFLCIFVYMATVVLTDSLTDRDFGRNSMSEELVNYAISSYGTIPSSFYSLLLCILDGISWGQKAEPLIHLHWSVSIIFFIYIIMAMLCVLNVITSIFVDSALSTASEQKELAIEQERAKKKVLLDHLKSTFQEIDIEGTGSITYEQLESFLAFDHGELVFSALDLDSSQVKYLFKIMDRDGSNDITVDEFVEGCSHVLGTAKQIDIQLLLLENERVLQKMGTFMLYVEHRFDATRKSLKFIQGQITDIYQVMETFGSPGEGDKSIHLRRSSKTHETRVFNWKQFQDICSEEEHSGQRSGRPSERSRLPSKTANPQHVAPISELLPVGFGDELLDVDIFDDAVQKPKDTPLSRWKDNTNCISRPNDE